MIQAIKFDKNIFKVNHNQNHKPHINIHKSTQRIPNTIVIQSVKTKILATLVSTQTNSSLSSPFQDFSI